VLQIRKNKAIHADSIRKGEGAIVLLSDRRSLVDITIRQRSTKGPGYARLSGGAIFWILHARN